MIRKSFYYLFLVISLALIAITLLSLIHNISLWFLQILDFPRIQYLVVGFICLAAMIATIKRWNWGNRLMIGGIVIAITIQAFIIFPYTKFASKEVATVNKSQVNEENSISLLVANVWLKNKNYSAFLDVVEKSKADIVMALEVNYEWIEEIEPLEKKYNYTVKKPYDNTYGMALYSKFPLKDTEILYLNNEKVPSIHTKVQMSGQKVFNLHVVHPVPPKPSKHPDNVGEKEIALVKVGNMVSNESLPAVVAGDFNDVAWSKFSRLFKENGQLNDIRVGRGFYNTFDATSGIMRWPLDHVYVTPEFKVMEVKRLGKFGSDHFPYLVELYLP